MGRGHLAGRGAVAGREDRRMIAPAERLPRPTSTSVPTIERTIWWQNALAVISKRSSRRSARRPRPTAAETTRRTSVARRLARRPASGGGRTT